MKFLQVLPRGAVIDRNTLPVLKSEGNRTRVYSAETGHLIGDFASQAAAEHYAALLLRGMG